MKRILVLCLFLAGCFPFSELSKSPNFYVLNAAKQFDPSLKETSAQLLIDAPVTSAGLDTARIALSPMAIRLDYYAGVSWVDTAPEMVQSLIIESFTNSGKIVSVGAHVLGLRADYILKTDLLNFQAEYKENQLNVAPKIKVEILSRLVKMPKRSIIASNRFVSVVQAEQNDIDHIVKAYDRALKEVMVQIVKWTLDEMAS